MAAGQFLWYLDGDSRNEKWVETEAGLFSEKEGSRESFQATARAAQHR